MAYYAPATSGGLTVMDWFCGAGGSSQGIDAVPGVEVTLAANHWELALKTHAENFPRVRHEMGDIRDLDVQNWPVADGFWASPECTKFSQAQGVPLRYLRGDIALPGMEPDEDAAADRSRALMWDVPKYLEGVQRRGKLVLFGVVENVIEAFRSPQFPHWRRSMNGLGYDLYLIAFNSMHAAGTRTRRAPQSRNRGYVGYIHRSVGRRPDWDKWLRPRAWCGTCDRFVDAIQVWKKPGQEMGAYRQQYLYRCPSSSCRNAIVEPGVLPAAAAIDWTLPAQRIGDREKPLADKTIARIEAGLRKFGRPIVLEAAGNTFERRPGVRTWPIDGPMSTQTTTATKAIAWEPFMVPAGGTWREDPSGIGQPMPTRTARENDALVIPPLLIPVEGRDGKEPASALDPLRTQTTRNETGLAMLPFIAELRGGSSDARAITDALSTVTASGNHHALITPDQDAHLLVPYYSNGTARRVSDPMGTLSTVDRYALVRGDISVADVLFRMLEPSEIGAAMAFGADYIVLGSKRHQVRQYGNAVTPPVAELIISALVEAVTGEPLERWALAA